MNVFVRIPGGKTVSIDIGVEDTIGTFKEKLLNKCKIEEIKIENSRLEFSHNTPDSMAYAYETELHELAMNFEDPSKDHIKFTETNELGFSINLCSYISVEQRSREEKVVSQNEKTSLNIYLLQAIHDIYIKIGNISKNYFKNYLNNLNNISIFSQSKNKNFENREIDEERLNINNRL